MRDPVALDSELAEFTDRLRAGDDPDASSDLVDLAETVRALDRLMPSHPLGESTADRLWLHTMTAWDRHYGASRRWWQSLRTPMWMVAAAVWVVVFALVLVVNVGGSPDALAGTALGDDLSVVVLLAVPVTLAGVVWWMNRVRS